jgi:chaperonin GroEL
MTAKRFYFRSEARDKVLRGASVLADAVRGTLGPKARCVLIEQKWGRPLVSDDGVSIVKEVELENPEENLGAQMLRQAAEQTGDRVGDGTTTSTLLAYEILAEGIKNVAAGASAIDLNRGLQRGLGAALVTIRQLARPVETLLARTQVATISAHNDPSIGACRRSRHEGRA